VAVSLWGHRTSAGEVLSQHRQLALDVQELYDKVDHWQRRERVRKMRDGQELAAKTTAAEQELPMDAKSVKAMLREQVFGGR
jgi:hypothetical protein